LTLFVAVLCSLGVCAHWVFSVVMAIGGIAGRIVAGTLRFVEGALVFVLLILSLSLGISCVSQLRGTPLMLEWEVWQEYWVLAIAGIVGGVLGGFRAGKRNWFDRDQDDLPRP
jgi:drug/metabolite transporter (DMT)-like permease